MNQQGVKIKFCGLRRCEDIKYVSETAPDYAGFILSAGFKRSVSDFPQLAEKADKKIKLVGVYVNEPLESVSRNLKFLDSVQLHGDEDERYISSLRSIFGGEIWKAVRLRSVSDVEKASALDADRYVLDAFSENAVGGTGKRIDASLLDEAVKRLEKPFFIAGGISAENIAETVRRFEPYGIDLSSSVEKNGFKDLSEMKRIMKILREENLR